DLLGKACVVPNSLPHGIVVADVVRVRVDESHFCRPYAVFAINSPAVVSQINQEMKGSTRPRVNLNDLRDLEIPLAPLSEQQRIVAKLEKLLGKVDACQRRLVRTPALLKRFRQSVLAAACSGRLTADWRERNPNIASVTAVFPNLKDTTDLPDTWAWCPFGDYVENFDGKRIPISANEREKRKGKFPYYGASGVI